MKSVTRQDKVKFILPQHQRLLTHKNSEVIELIAIVIGDFSQWKNIMYIFLDSRCMKIKTWEVIGTNKQS